MKYQTSIEYSATKFKTLLDRIKNGEIKIPPFQRTFDWSAKDMARFYNSIIDGEPFGSIMLWTDNSNTSKIKQTNYYFNKLSKNYYSSTNKTYLIDGQQRVTTFAILYLLHNNYEYNAKYLYKPETIFFDIKTKKFYFGKKRESSILAHNFFYDTFRNLRKKIFHDIKLNLFIKDDQLQDFYEDIKDIYDKFNDVSIGKTEVFSPSLDDVINIFTLINTKGRRLSAFNIAHANFVAKDFDLDKKFSEIIKNSKKQFYEFTKPQLLIMCYSVLKNTISNANILKHSADDITSNTINYIENEFQKEIEQVIYISKETLGFLTLDFVPSGNILNILINLVHEGYKFDLVKNGILKRWVKLAVINDRYTSGSEGLKQTGYEKDLKLIKKAFSKNDDIDNLEINGDTWISEKDFSEDSLMYENYGSGSATYKYAMSKIIKYIPSIISGNFVEKNSFSKMKELNIHHIFPKGNKKYKDNEYINSLGNLTPLEKDENIDINNEDPKIYLNNRINNKEITKESLNNAFININKINNIDEFIKERAKSIAKLINEH